MVILVFPLMIGQKPLNIFLRQLALHLLVLSNKRLQFLNQNLLDLASQHLTCSVLLSNLRQFLVIFHEKLKIVVGDIDLEISTVLLLFLLSRPSTTKGVPSNLLLDLLGSISHEDTRSWIRTRHLSMEALESREEFSIHTCRLWSLDLSAHISCHPEVGVLVDSAWYQTGNILITKHMWEAR